MVSLSFFFIFTIEMISQHCCRFKSGPPTLRTCVSSSSVQASQVAHLQPQVSGDHREFLTWSSAFPLLGPSPAGLLTGSAPDGTAAALFVLTAHLPHLSLPAVFRMFSLEVPLGAVPSEGGHQPAPSAACAAGGGASVASLKQGSSLWWSLHRA